MDDSNLMTIEVEEACAFISKQFYKLTAMIEGQSQQLFCGVEYIHLYTLIYKLSAGTSKENEAKTMYNHYKKLLEEYIELTVSPPLMEKQDMFFLEEFVRRWAHQKDTVRWLSHFFIYLDRYYIEREKLPTLKKTGLACFYDKVFNEVKGKATDVILNLIERERDGEQINRNLIKQVIAVFIEVGWDDNLQPYEDDFEAHMLQSTTVYYSRLASNHIYADSCPEYMLMAEGCLKKEKSRAAHYLHSSTEDKLLEKTQHELLFVNVHTLIENQESGLHVLLHDGKVEHLTRMFKLFSKITSGLEPIAALFQKHLTEVGMALVKQTEDATSDEKVESLDAALSVEQGFVRKVIDLHDKYMGYVNNCFMEHTLFVKALKEAFDVFCNKSIVRFSMPELLAIFCDNILKKGGGSEKQSNEATEELIEKAVVLLSYIHEKDLFTEFCRRRLARRLLNNRSASEGHEEFILSKLKQQLGAQFTSKMEGMMTDFTLTKENQKNFENYIEENPLENPGIIMTATVLTSGFWPTFKSSDLNVPAEMRTCIEVFKKFYHLKMSHRKLTWIFSHGTCNIVGKFKTKPIELMVTTSQAVTLLMFNSNEKMSYEDIKSQLNLIDDDVMRLLHSLSCATYKILKKEPVTKTISSTDTFEFNDMFTNKMKRIKIPPPPVDEKKKVLEDVKKDRRYMIDAALVRIMKSRKTLGFQQLLTECVEMLNGLFKPDVKAIKMRIECLIERDYLARDENNASMLVYVA